MSVTKDKSKAIVLLLGLCSFVSYTVFHGLAGKYIFSIYAMFQDTSHSWGPNPEAEAKLIAAAMVGTLIGSYVGALSWLSHRLFKQKLGFALRVTAAVAAPALMGAGLLTIVEHPNDWRALAIYFIPGGVLGLTTGLIAEASRNPWNLLFRAGQRQRENKPFAIVTGLALRLGGLFGVLAFTFLLAAFSGTSGDTTLEDLVIISSVFTYFGLTILIALLSPPRWIVLITGLLINVPTVFLAVRTWDVAKSWAIPIIYLLLWFLYIVSRTASGKAQKLRLKA